MNILNLINHKETKPVIWIMRQAGRYLPEYQKVRNSTNGFLDLCYNPDLACEVTLQPLRRFDLDAAIIFSDILVIPDAMGMKVSFVENSGPLIEKIQTSKELEAALKQKNEQNLEKVYQAIEKTREKLNKNIPLIGFSGGAWTVAAYIVEGKISKDLSVVKACYYNKAEFFKDLIDHLVENIANHLINQVKAGANILQIFDSWAGVLIGADYEKLVIEPTQRIIKKVREKYPAIPIICFPRSSGFQYQKFAENIDCQVIGIDQYIPMKQAKEQINEKILQGNLDPLILLSNSKDLIKQRVDQIFAEMEGTQFIFNLGHGIVPQTPIENVEFLVNYVKKQSY